MPPIRITSPSNPRLKSAIRLRDSRYRRREGMFLVDGTREFRRALQAGAELVEVYVSESAELPARLQRAELTEDAANLVQLPAPLFASLAYGNRDEGLVGLFRTPQRSLADFHPPLQGLLIVLDQLEKPGNIGAIFRSADAAGADGVLLSDCGRDLFNPNTIRASAGTLFRMPCAVATASEVRQWLRRRGVRAVATRVDAPITHWECDWRGGVAIVMGNEATGLGPAWSGHDVTAVRIPMAGVSDSLNASVTAAVCLFEAVRQRGT